MELPNKFTFEYFNGKKGEAEKNGYDWKVTWPNGNITYYSTAQVAGYVDRGEWKLLAATMGDDYSLTWTFKR
jgi:hypothetical protein